MAATTRVPLEMYLKNADYEPDAEYVDGEIEERPMGEYSHSAWQMAISLWFSMNASLWNVLVCPELRVQTTLTHFRVPDVSILDASLPREPIATHPPLAAFEILSPEDRIQRMERKLDEYDRMGISAIWVVDPNTGVFERYVDSQLVRHSEITLASRGVSFSIEEIARLVR